MRVPAGKLDALLARSGELLVAGRRLGRAEDGLAALGEQLARLQREWLLAKKSLRQAVSAVDAKSGAGLGGAKSGAGLGGAKSGAGLAGAKSGASLATSAVDARLGTARAELERLLATFRSDRRTTGQAVALMDEEVRRARLVTFSQAVQPLERVVRDLAKEKGKEVDLVVQGASLELDRSILEGLKDPLLSLVRNSVDHGIETPDERRRAGKSERGRILVAAALAGSRVEVSVADDGAGVDLSAVRECARRRGLPVPEDENDVSRLLCEPGFSTAASVTAISGRGVGLDIVKSRVEALHGTVELAFEAGRGLRVLLTLPATLTTIRALLVSAGGETLVLPGTNVVRLLRLAPAELRTLGGREVVVAQAPQLGQPIPIFSLARVLGLPAREATRTGGKLNAVVIGTRTQAAFAVDEILAEREILVKPLGRRLEGLRSVAGATILETGRVALVLNAAEIARAALEGPAAAGLAVQAAGPAAKKRIILADDSVTTRSLERAILESAGYEVLTAVDGEEAWRIVQERRADLVVSDVDMPRMDGIALCRAIRGSKRYRELPVVLVTSLDSEQDKVRGADAGADAYIMKSGFDQRDLLSTVASLLGGPA